MGKAVVADRVKNINMCCVGSVDKVGRVNKVGSVEKVTCFLRAL